jgi:hypothetical protein
VVLILVEHLCSFDRQIPSPIYAQLPVVGQRLVANRRQGRFVRVANVAQVANAGRLPSEMRILYKPFAIIAALISARVGHGIFKQLWSRLDAGEPPRSRTPDATMTKVVTAAALEAATMAGIAAAVDRASAKWFHYLTGIWPGYRRHEGEEQPERRS